MLSDTQKTEIVRRRGDGEKLRFIQAAMNLPCSISTIQRVAATWPWELRQREEMEAKA